MIHCISNRLRVDEPITVPMARSAFLFRVEIIAIINSGNEYEICKIKRLPTSLEI